MNRVTITIEIDPNDQPALAAVLETLSQLAGRGSDRVDTMDSELREDWALAMTRGYGSNRRLFLREVAEASLNGSGLRQADCSLSAQGLGGTRSSLEKAWRGLGGTGEFMQWTRGQRYLMTPEIATAVLSALDATEATEPTKERRRAR